MGSEFAPLDHSRTDSYAEFHSGRLVGITYERLISERLWARAGAETRYGDEAEFSALSAHVGPEWKRNGVRVGASALFYRHPSATLELPDGRDHELVFDDTFGWGISVAREYLDNRYVVGFRYESLGLHLKEAVEVERATDYEIVRSKDFSAAFSTLFLMVRF